MIKKFVFRFLLFFLILFIAFETGCRILIDHRYFKQTNLYSHVKEKDTIDFIFIGSSRTAASIVPEVFSGSPYEISINAGRGYSTAQTHYRALRYLLRRNPDALRNCSVFLEAPGGQCYSEDGRVWIYEQNTNLIIPYIDIHDLREFLRYAADPFRTKADVVMLYYSAAVRGSDFIREKTDKRIKNISDGVDKKLSAGESVTAQVTDLKGGGGIRQDSAAVEEVKKLAYAVVPSDIKKQKLFSAGDLDNSMLARMNRLVSDAGGRIYLFETPLSSVIHKIYETEIAVANKITFDQWVRAHGIPVLKAPFVTTDADFPDLFHLKASRAEEYTDSLKTAYTLYQTENTFGAVVHN